MSGESPKRKPVGRVSGSFSRSATPPEEFPSERPTGTICVACSGEGKTVEENATGLGCYKAVACPWCTNGVMDMDQLQTWKSRPRKT